jgi:cytochrome c-type biogenesis protein CcmE
VNEKMIYVVIVGFAGALLMFAGDMLLYYTPEDFAYDSKSSSAEKIQAIVDVMKKLPAKRVMVGGMVGPVSAFLQCVGFYHIVLITDDSMKTLAMVRSFFRALELLPAEPIITIAHIWVC